MSCQLRYVYIQCVEKREDVEKNVKTFCAFIIEYYDNLKKNNNNILPNCYIATTAHVFECNSPPCVFMLMKYTTILLTMSSYDYFLSEFVNDRFRNYDGVEYGFIFML